MPCFATLLYLCSTVQQSPLKTNAQMAGNWQKNDTVQLLTTLWQKLRRSLPVGNWPNYNVDLLILQAFRQVTPLVAAKHYAPPRTLHQPNGSLWAETMLKIHHIALWSVNTQEHYQMPKVSVLVRMPIVTIPKSCFTLSSIVPMLQKSTKNVNIDASANGPNHPQD